jgi:alpha-galactosidase
MVKMAGLDPSKQYRIHELNRIDNEPLAVEGQTFSGAYLMANGLDLPTGHNVDWEKQTDYASRVLWLEEVK